MKPTGAALEQPVRFARELVALVRLLADRQQPDARALDAQHETRVGLAHHGELHEVRRAALDAGARVDEHGRPGLRSGMTAASAGRSTPGIMPKALARRHDRRPGVPGADERVGLARGDEFGGDADRRPRAAAQRERRGLVVRHCLLGIDHFERAGVTAGERAQDGRHARLGPHEEDADVEMACGGQSPFDHDGRGMVTAHGINGNAKHDPAVPGSGPGAGRCGTDAAGTRRDDYSSAAPARTCRSR